MELGVFSLSLCVKDLSKSIEFYQKIGFQVFAGDSKHYVIMQNSSVTIGLFKGMFEKNTLTFNPGWDNKAQTLKSFTDIRKIQKKFKQQGIEFAVQANESSEGPASFIIIDPDGNPVLFDQHV